MYEQISIFLFGIAVGWLIFGPSINLEEHGGNDDV